VGVGVGVGVRESRVLSSSRGLGDAHISHAFDKGWLMNVQEVHDQHTNGCWGLGLY
jgi:hypothetical protein